LWIQESSCGTGILKNLIPSFLSISSSDFVLIPPPPVSGSYYKLV